MMDFRPCRICQKRTGIPYLMGGACGACDPEIRERYLAELAPLQQRSHALRVELDAAQEQAEAIRLRYRQDPRDL